MRLVKRRRGKFSPNTVHERWLAEGRVVQLPLFIDNYSFRNYAEMIEKLQCYSTLAVRDMATCKLKVYAWSPLLHGGWMFFSTYFLQLGFL